MASDYRVVDIPLDNVANVAQVLAETGVLISNVGVLRVPAGCSDVADFAFGRGDWIPIMATGQPFTHDPPRDDGLFYRVRTAVAGGVITVLVGFGVSLEGQSPELLESTLFGHVKGAFTGAVYPKKGLCDMADKGTIFFDEIGNIPLETQAKLLRVIQEREFMRLGGMETIKVDVRIIAATNCDLKQMMEAGRFREDLYYRLHVINIYLPPLRQRKEDIPVLAQHFLVKYGEENNKRALELAPEALDLLMDYHWPGNVRELENVMERAVVLATGTRIGTDLIPDHVRTAPAFQIPKFVVPPEGISFKDVITNVEKRLIESTLEAAGGVQKRAAELLGIKPTTLNEMIKRYEIGVRRSRKGTVAGEDEDSAEMKPGLISESH